MAKTSIPVPRTDAQAEQQLAQIGALDRDIAAAKVQRDEAVALLEAQHAARTKPLIEDAERLREGLEEWAVANRARLTEGGKKSVKLATGEISWRSSGIKVEVEGDEAKILAAISKRIETLNRKIQDTLLSTTRLQLAEERSALQGFVRLKTELDKQSLKKRPEIAKTIRGVRIVVAEERFTITPLASQIREVA